MKSNRTGEMWIPIIPLSNRVTTHSQPTKAVDPSLPHGTRLESALPMRNTIFLSNDHRRREYWLCDTDKQNPRLTLRSAMPGPSLHSAGQKSVCRSKPSPLCYHALPHSQTSLINTTFIWHPLSIFSLFPSFPLLLCSFHPSFIWFANSDQARHLTQIQNLNYKMHAFLSLHYFTISCEYHIN